jgi:hypothetical protein
VVQGKKVSDLIGLKKERLTVIEYLGVGKHQKHYWKCICECGGSVVLPTYRITGAGATASCGCFRKETLKKNRASPVKHNISIDHPKLYHIYSSMKARCYNPNSQRWKYYGERGVKVCDEWLASVKVFAEWSLANGYEIGLSIDRLDSSRDYCPENCQWVSVSENSRRMNETRRNAKTDRGRSIEAIQAT